MDKKTSKDLIERSKVRLTVGDFEFRIKVPISLNELDGEAAVLKMAAALADHYQSSVEIFWKVGGGRDYVSPD